MIIENIKNNVVNNLNKPMHFVYTGLRNQVDEFDGVIIKFYKYVFLVKIDGSDVIKSFSYSDVLVGSLVFCIK